jgi:hypothetical protein
MNRGSGNSSVLNWNTTTGRVYTLWWSTNIKGSFIPVPGASNLSWTIHSFTNPIQPASPIVLYRLQVWKP